jgi:hemoglobin
MRPPATGTPPTHDITDEADVSLVVRRFYQAAIPDPVLGHLFRVGGIEWDSHIPTITSFWCRVLLGLPGYAGNPAAAHVPIMADPMFDDAALARWVELFAETIDEDFVGPVADEAKARAAQVASVLGTLAGKLHAA